METVSRFQTEEQKPAPCIARMRAIGPVLRTTPHYELEQSPSERSCENRNNASAAKPSATHGSALGDARCSLFLRLPLLRVFGIVVALFSCNCWKVSTYASLEKAVRIPNLT